MYWRHEDVVRAFDVSRRESTVLRYRTNAGHVWCLRGEGESLLTSHGRTPNSTESRGYLSGESRERPRKLDEYVGERLGRIYERAPPDGFFGNVPEWLRRGYSSNRET